MHGGRHITGWYAPLHTLNNHVVLLQEMHHRHLPHVWHVMLIHVWLIADACSHKRSFCPKPQEFMHDWVKCTNWSLIKSWKATSNDNLTFHRKSLSALSHKIAFLLIPFASGAKSTKRIVYHKTFPNFCTEHNNDNDNNNNNNNCCCCCCCTTATATATTTTTTPAATTTTPAATTTTTTPTTQIRNR